MMLIGGSTLIFQDGEKADADAASLPTAAAVVPLAAVIDGPAVSSALLDLIHTGIEGRALGGCRVALTASASSEQDVTLTMLR